MIILTTTRNSSFASKIPNEYSRILFRRPNPCKILLASRNIRDSQPYEKFFRPAPHISSRALLSLLTSSAVLR